MKTKISGQFFVNYVIVFLLSVAAALLFFIMLSFADGIISRSLVKNLYPASIIMRDDYSEIDPSPVLENGGGVQVISREYKVVLSEGLDTIGKSRLSPGEFTEFLQNSRSTGTPYNIDVLYNEAGGFWLIVSFPTSIRLDFALVYNREAISKDLPGVSLVIFSAVLFYLALLSVFAAIFSKITSVRITDPLKKLCEGTSRLREGDYSARVDLRLKNEFKELQDTFNDMARRIESETAMRKQAEADQKRMILDISHDLKNPLASVTGYAELCLAKSQPLDGELRGYIGTIHKNSLRAADLLTELFELSRLDSPAFSLRPEKTDICEYLRTVCSELLPEFEKTGFTCEFNIPEDSVFAMIDTERMSRMIHNLADNAMRYNPAGTTVTVELKVKNNSISILFKDNGVGLPSELSEDIFKPFVRADDARNSHTGGSGLGLSIAKRLVEAHGGRITLSTGANLGCAFEITLPAA